MAAQSEPAIPDPSTASTRPIELITENGFRILRADDVEAPGSSRFGEYRFFVLDPQDRQTEITVRLSQESIAEIAWRGRGRISNESSYWICCAERHLTDYLLEHDNCPLNNTLRIEILTSRDLNSARRWGRGQ